MLPSSALHAVRCSGALLLLNTFVPNLVRHGATIHATATTAGSSSIGNSSSRSEAWRNIKVAVGTAAVRTDGALNADHTM